ncbi:MAG: IS110 family transposase [Oscillospiraceae bacterium]|nr:IS110 family transposase [Oscillospiraceae bacterium]
MTIEDKDEVYYERCAGIDVHKSKLVVCLRKGRKAEVREFGTLTHEIREMVAWLKGNGCQMIAMESTGSYWKPLYNIFEQEEMPAMVCNAYHIKNVPGRKTDVNDAQWIAKCLSQGLLKPSFVPDREQRELRDMTRFRKSQVEERARNVNRLQKFLEGANIKLGDYVTEIEGKSATALLELVIGKPDFTVDEVAVRMVGNLKATPEELFKSLEGSITPMQRGFFSHVMQVIKEQTAQIEKTDEMIQGSLSENYKAAVAALDEIPGVGKVAAEQIIAETGTDMSRFQNQNSLCKWAGVCPGNNESAGKRKSGKTPPGNQALKTTLTQCAKSAVKKKIRSSPRSTQGSSHIAAKTGQPWPSPTPSSSPSTSCCPAMGSATSALTTTHTSTGIGRSTLTSSNSPSLASPSPMISSTMFSPDLPVDIFPNIPPPFLRHFP